MLGGKEEAFDDFFDHFFNDNFFAPFSGVERKISGFKIDVVDQGDAYVIEADLPGFEKEDVTIEYKDKKLTILAKQSNQNEEKSDHYIRRERFAGTYQRSFFIDSIEEESIEATFKNGVLRIVLKKHPLSKDVKKIEIQD